MTDIRNGINAGKTVMVHDTEINFNGWSGTGYTILDPESGAGAYMIGGGIDGGYNNSPFPAFLTAYLGMLKTTTYAPEPGYSNQLGKWYFGSENASRAAFGTLIKRLGYLGLLVSSFNTYSNESLDGYQKLGVISINILAFALSAMVTSLLLSSLLFVNILLFAAVIIISAIIAYWLKEYLFLRES